MGYSSGCQIHPGWGLDEGWVVLLLLQSGNAEGVKQNPVKEVA
jgi:hypothetical protein